MSIWRTTLQKRRDTGKSPAKRRLIEKLVNRYVGEEQGRSRAWGLVLLLLFIAGSAVHVLLLRQTGTFLFEHSATLVALTPSMVALVYLVLVPRRVYDSQFKAVKEFQKFQKQVAESLYDGKTFMLPTSDQAVTSRSELYSSRALQYFFGSLLLAIPFLLVAVLSDVINEVRSVPWYSGLNAQLQEAIQGLTFAGYGVFVYTLVVMIHRIHAAALSSQFLLTSTLRAVIMMTLGFAIGVSGVVPGQETPVSAEALAFPWTPSFSTGGPFTPAAPHRRDALHSRREAVVLRVLRHRRVPLVGL